MNTVEILETLKRHENGWLRSGPVAMSGSVIGYAEIAGPRRGQQIWINNYGTCECPSHHRRSESWRMANAREARWWSVLLAWCGLVKPSGCLDGL